MVIQTPAVGRLVSPFRDLGQPDRLAPWDAATEHETPPASAEAALVRSAVASGRTGVNELTDLVFSGRHPERGGRQISRSEPDFSRLSQEWLTIRDTVILPELARRAAPGTWGPGVPAGGPQPGTPTAAPSAGGGLSGRFENGRIPTSALCPVRTAPAHLLECSAARAFDRLNTAYRARFGLDVTVNDAYRSYERQVEMKRTKGDLAATPGTSNHGWGKALDLGGMNNGVGPTFEWFTANASRYGWVHPPWARPTGSKPEAWHWEYQSG